MDPPTQNLGKDKTTIVRYTSIISTWLCDRTS